MNAKDVCDEADRTIGEKSASTLFKSSVMNRTQSSLLYKSNVLLNLLSNAYRRRTIDAGFHSV